MSCSIARRSAYWCTYAAVLATLGACSGAAVKPGGDARPAGQPAPTAPLYKPQSAVARLLDQADSAYQRGRYTLPAENNALDRYQAALLLDPGNVRAKAGLDAVLLAYIDQVRAALSAGRISEAREMILRGREQFQDAPLLLELEDEMQQVRAAASVQREALVEAQSTEGERFALPAAELDRRSEQVGKLLRDLVARVRGSNESVMIYARSDREGRWIYKLMQDAAGEHRIRGDIRISKVPSIVLMEPL